MKVELSMSPGRPEVSGGVRLKGWSNLYQKTKAHLLYPLLDKFSVTD